MSDREMNIVTPCHGEPLLILTRGTGGWIGGDEVDEIMCPADGCYNTWDPKGVRE